MIVAAKEAHVPSRAYRGYALGILTLVYTLNFVDRQVVIILAESIKHDLHMADWQIGMMSGFAFAILYTVMGLPIARLAEHANRPIIIALATATWSVFTMLCGGAQTFVHMIAARIGVGVGEAGCTPPALSLISDYFPKERRTGAVSIYLAGASLGALLGMAIGGLISDNWGWRMAFVSAGAPGVILALILVGTLREPRKHDPNKAPVSVEDRPGFGEVLRYLHNKRAFVLIVAGLSSKAFLLYGLSAFFGSFFFRTHGAELATLGSYFHLQAGGFLGLVLGLAFGGGGALGSILGGLAADRFATRDLRALTIIPAISAALAVPLYLWCFLSGGAVMALAALTALSVIDSLGYGPPYSAVQGLVPPHMRATATSITLFCVNLLGLGLGPLAIGSVSDLLAYRLGLGAGPALQLSMVSFALLGILPAYLFWRAGKVLREDTES
jgi:MFS family permease